MKHITDKEQFESGAMRGVQDETTPRFDLIDPIFYERVSGTYGTAGTLTEAIKFCLDVSRTYHETQQLSPSHIDSLYVIAQNVLDDLHPADKTEYYAWECLAILLAQGANKYSDRNWEKGMPIKRTFASLCRHLFKYQHELETGERIDDEDHGAAVLFNLMAILHTWRNYGNQFDVET